MARIARNEEIARTLHEIADLLEIREENPYRVRAWRRAAQGVTQGARSPAR